MIEFRLRSPLICAECHTDSSRMEKYGISTQVLKTYVADFHGTTVTLFERISPDSETNKPVCFDCHGVHDIKDVDDPEKGIHVRENLLARCQQCHPEATTNFPNAWLSHYIPSKDTNRLVYYVNQFYLYFIPAVLGGMALLVVLDAGWRVRKRLIRKEPRPKRSDPAPGGRANSLVPPVAASSTTGVNPMAGNPERTSDGAGTQASEASDTAGQSGSGSIEEFPDE